MRATRPAQGLWPRPMSASGPGSPGVNPAGSAPGSRLVPPMADASNLATSSPTDLDVLVQRFLIVKPLRATRIIGAAPQRRKRSRRPANADLIVEDRRGE